MNVTHALVCSLSRSRAVCTVLLRLASCRYPLCIHWCLLYLSFERSTTGQVTEFLDVYRMRILWSFNEHFVWFLYGAYSFSPLYICYTYVSWPLFVRYLLGMYALLATSASTFTATETTAVTGLTFFSFFLSIQRLLLLSVNMWQPNYRCIWNTAPKNSNLIIYVST